MIKYAFQTHCYSIITMYIHIYVLTSDSYNDQLPVGLIAQLVEHCTGIVCPYILLFTYLFLWMLKFKIGDNIMRPLREISKEEI